MSGYVTYRDIDQYRDIVSKAVISRNHLQSSYENNIIKQKKLKSKLISIDRAQALIQNVAKDTQEQLRGQVTDMVNLALEICFPNMYSFSIEFRNSRGRVYADLLLAIKNNKGKYEEAGDIMDSFGGGVVDLISFALRIVIWSFSSTDAVILLDEPFKWLQPNELHQKGMELILMLSNKLGIQFIINSNSIDSSNINDIADKVFEIRKHKGISIVKES